MAAPRLSRTLSCIAGLAMLCGLRPAVASSDEPVAGYLFGQPVPRSNYEFAKRVAHTFVRPWERSLAAPERERKVWEALILHYESFRRGVAVSEAELEEFINELLAGQGQRFTRSKDAEQYAQWVRDTLQEDVRTFEEQMRYLAQIEKLKRDVRAAFPVTVTDEEMQQEFLDEAHHVAGEVAVFDSRELADVFYQQHRAAEAWEAAKAAGQPQIRPFNLITLEAIIDLWDVPRAQAYALHALEPGTVAPPTPFGSQWGVCRLLDKRSGDLADFPARRPEYERQLTERKKHQALKRWIEELTVSADAKVSPALAPPEG